MKMLQSFWLAYMVIEQERAVPRHCRVSRAIALAVPAQHLQVPRVQNPRYLLPYNTLKQVHRMLRNQHCLPTTKH